jgi:hypothetical protein
MVDSPWVMKGRATPADSDAWRIGLRDEVLMFGYGRDEVVCRRARAVGAATSMRIA